MKNKICFMLIIFVLFFSGFGLSANQDEEPLKQSISAPNTQNKISLDIKGMDIIDVLKILSTRAGINIIVGKNVSGRVTLFLKDVDINDAFEIVILANDLAYEKKGGIINVMTSRDYELIYGDRFADKKQLLTVQLKYARAQALSQVLGQVKSNIGRVVMDEPTNTLIIMDIPEKLSEMSKMLAGLDRPLDTRIFNLNYAQADKLNPKIQEAITKGIGSIKIDERTNKIVITDYPEKLQELAMIISAFDEKTQQVLIDAQIIELKPSDEFKLGVDWDTWLKKNVRLATSLPAGGTQMIKIGMAVTGQGAAEKGEYKGIIDLLRTIGDVKILSSPRIMALNNQEAKILVGKKDPYITSTTSQGGSGNTVTSQSVSFVDSGIKLYVTPTVNRDGFVTMKIKPEISETELKSVQSEDKKTDVPFTTTSEAETTIMVKDGVTLIIGGLKKEKRNKTVTKIPFFGDIPLLGVLFTSKTDKFEINELVILLTPHIMSGESSFTDFSEIKPQDGAVARMENGNIIIEKVSNISKETSLEDATFDYYKLVTNKVKTGVSFRRPRTEKGEIRLAFTLSRDGNLITEPAVLEVNNSALIPFALRAIKDSSPFPPFPKDLGKDKETFKISLAYE